MKNLARTLILIRHAHRDNSDPDRDNGLSKKGKKQAELLADHLNSLFDLQDAQFLSSPKKRCMETLKPIAEKAAQTVEPDPLLTERQPVESLSHMKKRILQAFEKWKGSEAPIVLVCSHGDWLPYALEIITGKSHEFEKAGWAEIGISQSGQILTVKLNPAK